MSNTFKFSDYAKLVADQSSVFSNPNLSHKGLRVSLEATHSGIINGNNRFYIPSRMAEGVSTFRVGEKPTKIFKHHDLSSDPVGVIRHAQFVPTIPPGMENNPDVLTLLSSTASMKQQAKAFRNLYKSGILHQDGWRGLGFINLVADILDPLSIEQIKDGRFDAVSTNFISPKGVCCSHCAKDWRNSGYCEHEFGEEYEDEDGTKIPTYALAAQHHYLETSLVGLEGDQLVSITILDELNPDKKTIMDMYIKDNCFNSNNIFELLDSKEENMELSDREQKIFDSLKAIFAEMAEDKLNELTKAISTIQDAEKEELPGMVDFGLDYTTALQIAAVDTGLCGDFDNSVFDQKLANVLDGLAQEQKDAFFVAIKDIENFPPSAFADEKKLFPCVDALTTEVSLKLINLVGPLKDRFVIMTNLQNKKRIFDIPKVEDKQEEPVNITLPNCPEDQIKALSDADLRNVYDTIELELVSRGKKMAFECKECKIAEEKLNKAVEEITKVNRHTADLNNVLNVLRDELRFSQAEYVDQVNRYIELGAKLSTEKAEKFALMSVLQKKHTDFNTAKEAFMAEDLNKVANSFEDFNLDAIVQKLNDGLGNTPSGVVKDPTVNIDSNNSTSEILSNPAAIAAKKSIMLHLKNKNVADAKHIYDTMKSLSLFPEDLTFDSLLTENASLKS